MKTRRAENRALQPRWLGRMVLAGGFLIISVSPAFADFQSGLAAYAKNEYEAAFREWLPLAEQGDALAQLYVARMYEDGRGVRRSFGEAHRWFDRAAATFPPGEHQDRAVRGRDRMVTELDKKRVDPALVGSWRLTAPDPGGGAPSESLLEINDAGDFWLKTTRADSSRSENGTFSASDGKWRWKSPNEEQEGTYEVVHSDAIKLTDISGTAEWTRVGAIAQQPTYVSPFPSLLPETPSLSSWPEEFSPAEVPQTTEPPVTGGRVLFEDDFQSQSWQTGISDCARLSYGSGGFTVENVQPSGGCWFAFRGAGRFSDNVRIDLSAGLRKGRQEGAYGLTFGLREPGDPRFHAFAVNANGEYYLARLDDPNITPLIGWTADPNVRTGYDVLNNLAVEIQGSTIKVFIDGVQVGTADSPDVSDGYIGVLVGTPGMEVVLTNIRVTELPAPGVASRENQP